MKIDDLDEGLMSTAGNWLARKGAFGAEKGFEANRAYNKERASKIISQEFMADFQKNFDNAVKSGIIDVNAKQPATTPPPVQKQPNFALGNYKQGTTTVLPQTKISTPNQQQTTPPAGNGQTPTPQAGNQTQPTATPSSTQPTKSKTPGKEVSVKVGNEVYTKRNKVWTDSQGNQVTDKSDVFKLEQRVPAPASAGAYVREGALDDYQKFDLLIESAVAGELMEQDHSLTAGEWAEQYLVSKLGGRELTPKLKAALDKLSAAFTAKVNATGKFPTDVGNQMLSYLNTVGSMIAPGTTSSSNNGQNPTKQQPQKQHQKSTPDFTSSLQQVFATVKSPDNIPGAIAYLVNLAATHTGADVGDIMDQVSAKVEAARKNLQQKTK